MVANLMQYAITTVGLTDIGLLRQNNEDIWGEIPDLNFYVLADGMGGHLAGEIAAKECVHSLIRILKRKYKTASTPLTLIDIEDLLKKAISYINGRIYKMGRARPDLRGMGTTVCCLWFHDDGVAYLHVGDSRIYRFRHGQLQQLTKDHSLLCELVDQGQISERQAAEFLYKNIITKAIGTEPKVQPSISIGELEDGDFFLMCSDGLTDMLSNEEIEEVLGKTPSIKKTAEILVRKANENGGRDNITVVISKVSQK